MTPTGAALAEAVVWAVDSPRHACLRGLLWARAARRREREQGGDVAGWTAVVELLSRMLVTVAQWEREPLGGTATVGRPSGSDVSGQPSTPADATGAARTAGQRREVA